MKKRLFAILTALALCLTMLPTVALAEEGDTPVTFTAIAGTAGASDDEGYSNLFDGKSSTKWCVTGSKDGFGGAYVIFEASVPMTVTGYYITTGNDNEDYHDRNPKDWTLYGCNDATAVRDSESWEPIHSVTNDEVLKDKNNETYYYEVTGQEESYQYFKLEITATKGADVMQLSEFTLTSCDHNWVEQETTPATCTTKGYKAYTCTKCKNTKIEAGDPPLGHDFSDGDGKCTRCKQTRVQLYTFDVSDGRVTIMDDEYSGKLLVRHGDTYERYIDASQTITVTGSGTASHNELHVNATTPVTIKAENLNINRSDTNDAWAMSLDASKANVTLILEGKNSFAGGRDKAGISVGAGKTLTIEGTGSLAATGGSWAAGIGGDQNESCGTITINSGTVTATGGDSAAGIGGGNGGAGGSVTINGGIVNAKSDYGAGIGSGNGRSGDSTVTISGGIVNAESVYGVGIGSGASSYGDSTVTISGGTVNAQSTRAASNGSSGGDSPDDHGTDDSNGKFEILPLASSDGYFDKPDSGDVNGGSTGMSCGICAHSVTVKGGSVTATGGAATGGSYGIYIYTNNIVAMTDNSDKDESAGNDLNTGTLTMTGGSLLAQASDEAEYCAALSVEPDLTGYASYQWRTDAEGSYTAGNFVWNTNPYDTYVQIIPYVASSSDGGSSGPVTYLITVEEAASGSATSSHKRASKGTTVTLTVEPDKGYTLETLTVTDKNSNELKLMNKGDGKYTFKMPASNVTVKATFIEDNSMLNFFVDVPADAYYYDAVLWAAENGITGGVDDTHFAPNATCTRAQIVTFLWRAAGCPEPETMSSFADVPADSYYAKAVAWAVEQGITTGTGDGKFSPNAPCTRAQAVTFLWRSQKSPAAAGANSFTDVAADSYCAAAVQWAVENGITIGTGDGTTFSPNAICTRAQIVTFLYRCLCDE